MTADPAYLHLVAGRNATATLMRGFTTVRDAGGPTFGLKRAIDEGVVARTAHLPVRRVHLPDGRARRLPAAARSAARHRWSPQLMASSSAASAIADGVDEVTRAVARAADARRQPDQADGGRRRAPRTTTRSTSPSTPSPRCAPPSMRPRTGAPTCRSTPTRRARSRQAIAAGVRCIEHGQLADEADRRADGGARHLVVPPAVPRRRGRAPLPGRREPRQVSADDRRAPTVPTSWRRSTRSKLAWGTDILFDAELALPPGCAAREDDALVSRRPKC